MITGASSGIGRETAFELAARGYELILVCRDLLRGEATVREIVRRTRNASVDLRIADLSSPRAIRNLSHEFLLEARPLHVLVNNAGILNTRRRETGEGIEEVWAVNHLAYFHLTLLLLERIRESAPARVVNVSSDAHRMARIDLDDPGFSQRPYRGLAVYAQSKLANLLFSYELARRLSGTGVTVNCLHPGTVATGLGRNNPGAWPWLTRLISPLLWRARRGARTSVWLASAPEIEHTTGRYFQNCRERRSARLSYDRSLQRRLWELSLKQVGLG
ncbi:MAG: SDR family oxidoreductase [Myxococcales bacterium]|nr:SDR family oxidoreductase [Myxococcales bacterium]